MEQKTLEYEGSLCKEELILKVDSYRCKNRLFIAMIKKKDQEEELYDILTVSGKEAKAIRINYPFGNGFALSISFRLSENTSLEKCCKEWGILDFVIIGWCVLIWKSWQNMIGKA